MTTLISILAVLMLALNLPMTVALFLGIKLYTDSTCPEDIRSAKHNRMMLKGISILNLVFAVILFICSL
jgi:hypothetical protein